MTPATDLILLCVDGKAHYFFCFMFYISYVDLNTQLIVLLKNPCFFFLSFCGTKKRICFEKLKAELENESIVAMLYHLHFFSSSHKSF